MKKTNKKIFTIFVIILLLVFSLSSILSFLNTFPEINDSVQEDSSDDDHDNGPSEVWTGGQKGEPREIVAGPSIGDFGSNKSRSQIFWNRNFSDNDPLFYVKGANHTSYLKTSVGIQYDGNNWYMRNQSYVNYSGGVYVPDITEYSNVDSDKITVEPAVNFSEGFLPVSTYTANIVDGPIYSHTFLKYFTGLDLFYSVQNFSCPYSFYTIHYEYSDKQLNSANVSEDSKYLKLPDKIPTRVTNLADSITEGYNSPYKKAQRIKNYLISNYEFDHVSIPSDTNLVEWFLFTSNSGNSYLFSSAFTVLARAAGIPTRLVRGYKIPQLERRQTVVSKQSFYWAEVKLNLGWINVDLEKESDSAKPETETEIDYISSDKIYKTESVTVSGFVRDVSNRPIEGMEILIYLKEEKNFDNSGMIIGDGIVDDGSFNITCYVPDQIDVGSYQLMARAVENDDFAGSWSDPPVKVLSKTQLITDLKNKYCYNSTMAIDGRLEESTGEPLINKTVNLYINKTLIDSINTDENGEFTFSYYLHTKVDYYVRLQYNGSEYYSPSSLDKNISVGSATIETSNEDYLVRGEEYNIEGSLLVDDVGIGGMPVNLTIESKTNKTKITTTTNENGIFKYQINISRDIEPSSLTVQYEFSNNDYKKTEYLLVKADTDINISLSEEVKEGEKIELKASLRLDNGTELIGEKLKIQTPSENKNYTLTTNENGQINFTIMIPKDYDSNLYNISIEYQGNEDYDRCSSFHSVEVIPDKSFLEIFSDLISSNKYLLYFLIPLVVGISLIGFASKRGYLNQIYRWVLMNVVVTKKEKTSTIEKVKKQKRKKSDLKILFPQIKKGLPEVWGVNEKLKIIFKSNYKPEKINKVEIRMNGKRVKALKNPTSSKFSYVTKFENQGRYRFKLFLEIDGDVKREFKDLRIVDYRDEIQRVYTDFLNQIRHRGIEVKYKSTPMEIESKIIDLMDDSTSIRTITRIFEKAKYSYHDIDRTDYETIFFSKQELEGNIAS